MKRLNKKVAWLFLSLLGLCTCEPNHDLYLQTIQELEQDSSFAKAGTMLTELYKEQFSFKPLSTTPTPNNDEDTWNTILNVDDDNMVRIQVVASSDSDVVTHRLYMELAKQGFQLTAKVRHVLNGRIPVASLETMCDCNDLLFARPILSNTNAGSVTSGGLQSMDLDLGEWEVNGSGITVGVLSDSFNYFRGADEDMASNDLPPNIKVLKDDRGTDEGRAMMQIIHDVAPGAHFMFHTALDGQAAFAEAITTLANHGCQIIVDDILYSDEPFFQDGFISQAIDAVSQNNVTYITAIGNYGRQSYESPFVDSGFTSNSYILHNFQQSGRKASQFVSQQILLSNEEFVEIVLQWDEPFFSVTGTLGSASDLDIFVFEEETGSLIASGRDDNIGRDAIEIVRVPVRSVLRKHFRESEHQGLLCTVVIGMKQTGAPPPGLMKLIIFDRGESTSIINFPTNSGAAFGHGTASGGAGIAAGYYQSTPNYGVNPPLVQPTSSVGGTPILFGTNGIRLAEPQVRMQPRVTGPDGVATTFFGIQADESPDPLFFGNSDPLFFGSSAAASHVAGVAALMLETDPSLIPQDVFHLLEQTAIDMGDPAIPGPETGFDFRTGHGFVNASAALESVVARKHENDEIANGQFSSEIKDATIDSEDLSGFVVERKPENDDGQDHQYEPSSEIEEATIDSEDLSGFVVIENGQYEPSSEIEDATIDRPKLSAEEKRKRRERRRKRKQRQRRRKRYKRRQRQKQREANKTAQKAADGPSP